MKWKILLAISICLALCVGTALALTTTITSSYTLSAPTTAGGAQGTSPTGIVITPSLNVSLKISSAATQYALSACHQQGDKTFGQANNSSGVYFYGSGTNGCPTYLASVSGTDSAAFTGSGWISM